MSRFIVVTLYKAEHEEQKIGQVSIRKMSTSLESDTVFDDYFKANEYASNFKFSHVILEEDFQHDVKRSDLLLFTVRAYHEATKNLTEKVI